MIVEESLRQHISPLYMLARLETESSLVTSGTHNHIDSACGCHCPDGDSCDSADAGFARQIRCSAKDLRGYLDTLDTKKVTISGWKVGVEKSTSDPCQVTPKNRITAALYTYTPWVGAYGIGCGTSQWGGATLIPHLYRSWKSSFSGVDLSQSADDDEVQDEEDSEEDESGSGHGSGGEGLPALVTWNGVTNSEARLDVVRKNGKISRCISVEVLRREFEDGVSDGLGYLFDGCTASDVSADDIDKFRICSAIDDDWADATCTNSAKWSRTTGLIHIDNPGD